MPDPYASRDRAWLQTFLHLDALASPGNIPKTDIARQEDTVLRALTMLDQGPGVMLADGVGMGKTFEALGVLAAREQLRPGSRFLVLTPGPDLNRKWYDELERFTRDQRVFCGFLPDQYEAVTRLGPFLAAAARRRLVIAPVTMFLKQPEADRAFLLGAFCQWKGLHGATRTSLFRDVGFGLSARELQGARFLEQYRYEDLEQHAAEVGARGHQFVPIVAVEVPLGGEQLADHIGAVELAALRLVERLERGDRQVAPRAVEVLRLGEHVAGLGAKLRQDVRRLCERRGELASLLIGREQAQAATEPDELLGAQPVGQALVANQQDAEDGGGRRRLDRG